MRGAAFLLERMNVSLSEVNPILETSAPETPLIEVRNLRKVYQVPGGEVVALDGIDLTINRG